MFIRKQTVDNLLAQLETKSKLVEAQQAQLEVSEQREEYLTKLFVESLTNYVNSNYAPEPYVPDSNPFGIRFQVDSQETFEPAEIELLLKNVEQSFSDKLMEIIRTRNLNEVVIYKKAEIDRRHFSKIRSNSDYKPNKDTIILLCLSMKLTKEETEDLLKRAGFSLSNSSKIDIISGYFLSHKIYDIKLYKEVLYSYGFLKN